MPQAVIIALRNQLDSKMPGKLRDPSQEPGPFSFHSPGAGPVGILPTACLRGAATDRSRWRSSLQEEVL